MAANEEFLGIIVISQRYHELAHTAIECSVNKCYGKRITKIDVEFAGHIQRISH